MGQYVTNGAQCMCSFGTTPATLTVLPESRVMKSGQPAANIMDSKPVVNLATFGMCSGLCQANPAVASATAAATAAKAGVYTPTPAPCVPATGTPWVPGNPTTLVGGQPALTNDSKCMCTYGGVISITTPGQVTVES